MGKYVKFVMEMLWIALVVYSSHLWGKIDERAAAVKAGAAHYATDTATGEPRFEYLKATAK